MASELGEAAGSGSRLGAPSAQPLTKSPSSQCQESALLRGRGDGQGGPATPGSGALWLQRRAGSRAWGPVPLVGSSVPILTAFSLWLPFLPTAQPHHQPGDSPPAPPWGTGTSHGSGMQAGKQVESCCGRCGQAWTRRDPSRVGTGSSGQCWEEVEPGAGPWSLKSRLG